LSQLQQPIGTQEQAAPDTVALLAALKRLAGDNSPAPTDGLTRAEQLVPGAGAASAASSTGAPSTAGAPTVTVATAFGQADWDQALGDRIQWLVGQKVQGAQVKLNPANLGPLEVRIQMQNDQASIQFTAHHAVVREALEAALPRLREMLEASGVQLVDVDVSGQQSFAGRQQATEDRENPYWGNGFDGAESDQEIRVQTPLTVFDGRGRLDLFA
jgi:flagellar hook-length control protein FliK